MSSPPGDFKVFVRTTYRRKMRGKHCMSCGFWRSIDMFRKETDRRCADCMSKVQRPRETAR